MNTIYKLSPSDFKYLWEDCKHCFYRKIVDGVSLPQMPFPGIFTKMNGQMQKMAIGKDIRELVAELPAGKIHSQEVYLKSNPVPNRLDCYITGRLDILTEFEDGTFGIVDLKISDPKDESLYKFSRQLHAYKFAMENPVVGEPREISKLGLVIIAPQEVSFHKGHVFFRTKPVWKEFDIDMNNFYDFIDEIADCLTGPCPESTQGCTYCQYRTIEILV